MNYHSPDCSNRTPMHSLYCWQGKSHQISFFSALIQQQIKMDFLAHSRPWLYVIIWFIRGHKTNRYKSTLPMLNAGNYVLLYPYQMPHSLVPYKHDWRGGRREEELLTTSGNPLHICTSHLPACICWHWMLCNLHGYKLILYLDRKHYCDHTLLAPKLRSSVRRSMYSCLRNEKREWQNTVNLCPSITYQQMWWGIKLCFPCLRSRHCLYRFIAKNLLLQGIYCQEYCQVFLIRPETSLLPSFITFCRQAK